MTQEVLGSDSLTKRSPRRGGALVAADDWRAQQRVGPTVCLAIRVLKSHKGCGVHLLGTALATVG
jgi:hypothetical protein